MLKYVQGDRLAWEHPRHFGKRIPESAKVAAFAACLRNIVIATHGPGRTGHVIDCHTGRDPLCPWYSNALGPKFVYTSIAAGDCVVMCVGRSEMPWTQLGRGKGLRFLRSALNHHRFTNFSDYDAESDAFHMAHYLVDTGFAYGRIVPESDPEMYAILQANNAAVLLDYLGEHGADIPGSVSDCMLSTSSHQLGTCLRSIRGFALTLYAAFSDTRYFPNLETYFDRLR